MRPPAQTSGSCVATEHFVNLSILTGQVSSNGIGGNQNGQIPGIACWEMIPGRSKTLGFTRMPPGDGLPSEAVYGFGGRHTASRYGLAGGIELFEDIGGVESEGNVLL